jgi:hypothetical protein
MKLSFKKRSLSSKELVSGLRVLLCPYFGYREPKTLICLFRNGNLLAPPTILPDLRIKNLSPCGRYFSAKLYDTVFAEEAEDYSSHMDEPDYLLVKVPVSCVYSSKFNVKQLCS